MRSSGVSDIMAGMRLKLGIVLLGLGAALFTAAPGWAQVEIVAPPPERPLIPPEIVTPGQPPEVTHPSEADVRPDNIRTRHEPAFIVPFTATIRTGPDTAVRVGLSGWTAPPGRGDLQLVREISGWFALGLTIASDVPAEPAKPKPSPVRPPAPR